MSYTTTDFDERIIDSLKNGGVGCLPTDTVYGLSARALDKRAVERIHTLKRRSRDKPLIILISDIQELPQLGIDAHRASAVKEYWPGPLSVIFEAPSAPAWLDRQTGTLAVRLPDNKELLELIQLVGPVVSTSANTQDGRLATTTAEAKKYFGEKLDFYVDQGDLSDRKASTLARFKDNKLTVIRAGAVKI